jgi:hypothetical protein
VQRYEHRINISFGKRGIEESRRLNLKNRVGEVKVESGTAGQ